MPEFSGITLKGDDAKDPEKVQAFLRQVISKLSSELRGPVSIDLEARATTVTIEPYKADLTMVEMTGNVAITLGTNTRAGANGDILLEQDDTGGWVPTWTNATGPNGAVDAPAAGAHQKTLYRTRYTPDGWIVILDADNFRNTGADVGISAAINCLQNAMEPLPRTQVVDADYLIEFDGVGADRPDATATTLTGTITVPATRAALARRVYTTYASTRMYAKADSVPDTDSDTPYPRVYDVAFVGPPSPNYFIHGLTRGTTQSAPALAALPNPGSSLYSPGNWHTVGGSHIADAQGAYVRDGFTGTSLQLTVDTSALESAGAAATDYPWIAISIDGAAETRLQIPVTGTGTSTVSLVSGLADGTHNVTVTFESRSTFFDIWPTPSAMLRIPTTGAFTPDIGKAMVGPSLQKPRRMFFFGASADEAFPGALLTDPPRGRGSQSWCRRVADLFDAEFGIIAFAGQGYLNGGAWGVPNALSSYDLHTNGISRLSGGLFVEQPDIIVVTQGTNDDAGAHNDAAEAAAAQTFMGNLRAAAPAASIVISPDVFNGRTAAITTGFNAYVAANPTDTKVYLAVYNTREQGIIGDATMIADGHPNTAGHTALGPVMASNIARALGWTSLQYQVRADQSAVLQGFYDVDDDGGWGFFDADNDETHWEFTLITYPGTVSLLPSWTSVNKNFTVSSIFEIREASASMEDASGPYPSSNLAPSFSAFVAVSGYLDGNTLVAEVNPSPPGGVAAEARAYALWNTSTNMQSGGITYVSVPDRRVLPLSGGSQWTGLRLDVVRLTNHPAWADTYEVDATGRFSIPKPAGQRYELTLVDSDSRAVLGRASQTNGLPREFFFHPGDTDTLVLLGVTTLAYGSDFEETTFQYASAIAGLAFLTLAGESGRSAAEVLSFQKYARAIAHGLALSKQVDNGLPFAYPQRYDSDLVGLRFYRTNSMSWDAYFMQAALELVPASLWTGSYAAWYTAIDAAVDDVFSWLYGQVDAQGLIRFGTGKETGAAFDPTFQYTNHATEHQLDLSFALRRRAARGSSDEIAPGVTYGALATTIKTNVLAKHWRYDVGRFIQSTDANGVPEELVSGLDGHTWGALWLISINDLPKADSAIAWFVAQFGITSPDTHGVSVNGYTPYVAADGINGSVPSVWIEGTCGGLIALRRRERPNVAVHTGLARLQQSDGSFRNFQLDDETYGIRNFRSNQAASWFLLSYFPDVCLWTEVDA